jgi:N-acetylglutamate synthase-like GNAT family acetyltransferase
MTKRTLKQKNLVIRRAKVNDCKVISKFTGGQKKDMIKRGEGEIRKNIDNYLVVEHCGKVVGSVGYHYYDNNKAEIISFYVDDDYRKNGLGTGLIYSCLGLILSRGIYFVFTLTTTSNLFSRIGFKKSNWDIFAPVLRKKILKDCNNCLRASGPDDQRCNESLLVFMYS